jgi:hypothetical protein
MTNLVLDERHDLRDAFEYLGPERLRLALRSTRSVDWNTCFLACAYGERGELWDMIDRRLAMRAIDMNPEAAEDAAAAIMAMPRWAVRLLVAYFDRNESYVKSEAMMWLAEHGVAKETVVVASPFLAFAAVAG